MQSGCKFAEPHRIRRCYSPHRGSTTESVTRGKAGRTVSQMRGSRRAFGAVVVALFVAPTVAVAAWGVASARDRRGQARPQGRISGDRLGVEIQAVFNSAGNPLLVANFSPDGSLATPRWSICPTPAKRRCVAAPTRQQSLSPGPRPRGTVFRAAARYMGRTYTAQVTWGGTVTVLLPPSLSGHARVGLRLVPTPGIWRGGWGTEFDQLGVEVCQTRSARQCVMVSGGQLGCPDHSRAVIRRTMTGWYVFALDARSPADEACAGVAYGSESAIPVWPIGRTVVRSAPLGPVAAR
jgi:hypothetical protein